MKSFLLALAAIMIIGCSAPSEPDPQIEAKREAAAKTIRTIYDKVGGNWDALGTMDKANLLKEFDNNEANAKKMWDLIKSKSAPPAPAETAAPANPSGSSSMGAGSMRPSGQ